MTWLNIIFWICIGLLYLGITFPLQTVLIGVCALIIGVAALIAQLR